MARTGVDEFYETIRLLLAKWFWEGSRENIMLSYSSAQNFLSENEKTVERFVEGEALLCAPPEVAEECLRILTPTKLQGASYEVLHTVFEQMTGRNYKSEKGQYFTPPHVVDFCISVLRPKKGELICDPACGSGAFLKSAFDKIDGEFVARDIYGFDISKRAAKTAALLSYMACRDLGVISQLDSLAIESKSLFDSDGLSIEEFLRLQRPGFEGFDIIATNPPFAGDVSDADFLSYYQTSRIGGTKIERDTLFLERCWNLLKPGGRMAMVLPDNKFSGAKFSSLREWMLSKMEIMAVVSLHSYTFRPFTSQKACVLFAEKTSNSSSYSIKFYRSDRPGKSSNGEPVFKNDKLDHDLDEIGIDLIKEWKIG